MLARFLFCSWHFTHWHIDADEVKKFSAAAWNPKGIAFHRFKDTLDAELYHGLALYDAGEYRWRQTAN